MLNLILIDDDLLTLDILKTEVDWKSYGFSLAGVFSNSHLALGYIAEHKIDAIITDIRMPDPDGLEISRLCREQYPEIRIVILSAFRDFSYAQAAINYNNVVSYLTKPLDFKQFRQTLGLLRSACLQNYQPVQAPAFSDVDRLLLVCSNLLCGLFKTVDELRTQLATVNIVLDTVHTACSLVNIHIDGFTEFIQTQWHHDATRLYHAISNIVPFESEDAYFALARYSFGNLEWLIIHKTSAHQACIDKFSQSLLTDLAEIFSIQATVTKTLFYESIEAFIAPEQSELPYTNEEATISSALEYISQNFHKNLTLDEVAGHVFMSPSYFSMYFKKITHQKFIEHLTQVRMDKAAALLQTTGHSAASICEMVGYHHLGHFYDTFKKQFGMTPAEYKKQNKK